VLPPSRNIQTGYYRYRKRPTSWTQLRRLWLTGLIREIHIASRGTYGYRRIHAELTIGMDIQCSSRLVSVLMTKAGIVGLPGPTRVKQVKGVAIPHLLSTGSSIAST
jgi:hypothetical protein